MNFVLDLFSPKFRVWDNERKQMFYRLEIGDITQGAIDDYLIDTTGMVYKVERRVEAIRKGDRMTEYKIDVALRPAPCAIAMSFIANLKTSPLYNLDIVKIGGTLGVVIAVTNHPDKRLPQAPMLIPIAQSRDEIQKKFLEIYKTLDDLKLPNEVSAFWNAVEVVGNIFENKDLLTPFIINMLKSEININWEKVYE
jgi:hypothetical protein